MLDAINMESKDVVMTIAVVIGPILAVQAQKFIEALQEKRTRRMSLFQTLMSTRAERLNRDHVKALNMIDIEFYGRMLPFIRTRYQTSHEQAVTHCWKSYNSHLNQKMNMSRLTFGQRNQTSYLQICFTQLHSV